MSLEEEALEALRASLTVSIGVWRTTSVVMRVPDEHLRTFGHETPLSMSGGRAIEGRSGPVATALRVTGADHAARHYLLAPIDTPQMGDGTFPEIMACAARLRSRLSAPEQTELNVLLVAPLGADEDANWRQTVRQFESNEAIARVQVWAPPHSKNKWPQSLEGFTSRLFLGCLPEVRGAAADLAPTSAVLAGSTLPEKALADWLRVLLDTIIDEQDET